MLGFDIKAPTLLPTPPGLNVSEPESATVSRERRRVALAVKESVDQLSQNLMARLSTIEEKLDNSIRQHADILERRITRLEVLSVCNPSVDEVLDEMLHKKRCRHHEVALPSVPPFPIQEFAIFDDRIDVGVQVETSELSRSTCTDHAVQTNMVDGSNRADAQVQANTLDDLSPTLGELLSRLDSNAAYRTLCDIGREVYSETVDERLASHIDKKLREPGEWIPIPEGHAFKVGDMVKVKHAFIPDQDDIEIRLRQGCCGIIHYVDKDGDAQAWFPDLLYAGMRGTHVGHWMVERDFTNLELKS